MALDATVAGAAANSYLTVAEAEAFAATDPVAGAKWLTATLDEKEQLLVAATADVDLYRKSVGPRWLTTQARLFPRLADAVGDPLVPFLLLDVKRAAYEQAVYLQANGHLIAAAASNRASGHLSRSDSDGGWTSAINPTFGLYAPRMTEYLDRIGAAGRTGRYLVSVPMASSYS